MGVTPGFSSQRIRALEPSEAARFLKKLEVHSVYYMVKEGTFLKGNFCIYKSFHGRFLQFYIGVKENRKMRIWNVHLSCACVKGSTIQLVLRELLFRINLWEINISRTFHVIRYSNMDKTWAKLIHFWPWLPVARYLPAFTILQSGKVFHPRLTGPRIFSLVNRQQ